MKPGASLTLVLAALVATPALAQTPISYKHDIQPLFKDYCVSCHAPGGKGYEKSGLDLRSYQSLMTGTRFGPVIKPGDSTGSTLVRLIEGGAHPTINMPFGIKGSLSKEKTALIRQWVEQGAKDN